MIQFRGMLHWDKLTNEIKMILAPILLPEILAKHDMKETNGSKMQNWNAWELKNRIHFNTQHIAQVSQNEFHSP